MKTKHTPGPFLIRCPCCGNEEEHTTKRDMMFWERRFARYVAAPDLLTACKAAVARLAVLEEGSNLVAMLDRAIFKAEGREQ